MEFPTYKELGEKVAKEALDTFEYNGKTLREWIEIIAATEHGTNLAEVGTGCSEFPNNSDTISRQAVIDALDEQIEQCDKALRSFDISMKDEYAVKVERASLVAYKEQLEALPSAQPDIIQCRNCKFASGDSRICMKFGHSPIGELDFCAWAERRTDERFNQQTGSD